MRAGILSRHLPAPGTRPQLVTAFKVTFDRRGRDILESVPPGFSDEFATDQYKATQRNAFLCSQMEEARIELPQELLITCGHS